MIEKTIDIPESILKAGNVSYDNSASGLSATNVNAAIDEVKSSVTAVSTDLDKSLANTLLPVYKSFKLSSTGWYRIAEYSGGDLSTAKGNGNNSFDIDIRKLYGSNYVESHTIKYRTTTDGNAFVDEVSFGKVCNITKIRVVYNNNTFKSYVDIYYNVDLDNTMLINLSNHMSAYKYITWNLINPVSVTETENAVVVLTTHEFSQNKSYESEIEAVWDEIDIAESEIDALNTISATNHSNIELLQTDFEGFLSSNQILRPLYMTSDTGYEDCNELPIGSMAYTYPTTLNAPNATGGWRIFTYGAHKSWRTQIATDYYHQMAFRTLYSGETWSDWTFVAGPSDLDELNNTLSASISDLKNNIFLHQYLVTDIDALDLPFNVGTTTASTTGTFPVGASKIGIVEVIQRTDQYILQRYTDININKMYIRWYFTDETGWRPWEGLATNTEITGFEDALKATDMTRITYKRGTEEEAMGYLNNPTTIEWIGPTTRCYNFIFIDELGTSSFGGGAVMISGYTYSTDLYGTQIAYRFNQPPRWRHKANGTWSEWQTVGNAADIDAVSTQLSHYTNIVYLDSVTVEDIQQALLSYMNGNNADKVGFNVLHIMYNNNGGRYAYLISGNGPGYFKALELTYYNDSMRMFRYRNGTWEVSSVGLKSDIDAINSRLAYQDISSSIDVGNIGWTKAGYVENGCVVLKFIIPSGTVANTLNIKIDSAYAPRDTLGGSMCIINDRSDMGKATGTIMSTGDITIFIKDTLDANEAINFTYPLKTS